MTDDPLAALHGPRRFASPGGADRALRTGRRRVARRRLAGTAAGVSFAVVAGAALAAGGGSHAGLSPAGRVPASPGPAYRAAGPTPSPTQPAHPAAVPPPAIPGIRRSPEPGGPAGSPSAAPGVRAPRPDTRHWIGPSDHRVSIAMVNDPTACAAQPTEVQWAVQNGFCSTMSGPSTVDTGDTVELSTTLCRMTTASARTVTFSSAYEVILEVAHGTTDGEAEDWSWARPGDFAAHRHTVTFQPGDCRTWTVRWSGQGDDGYALAPGQYQVNGYAYAYDWVDPNGGDRSGPPPAFYTVTVDPGK
jgi:hypothetical protein